MQSSTKIGYCMSGFSLPTNFVENPEKLVRRVRPRVVPPPISQSTSELASQAPSITELMAEKTLRDFSVPSAANVATGPNVDVGDVNFELKSSLINMVQASPFCGKPNEDSNAHLQNLPPELSGALQDRNHTGRHC